MDPELKQRLVGAVVITCLAAIFVPMLFDDPIDQTGKMISELKIPDAPVKSVDLDSVTLPETIEDVISLPETESVSETKPLPKNSDEFNDLSETKSLAENNDEVNVLSETKSSSETQPVKEEIANQQTTSNLVRWFLQVGTFGEKSNALSLQNKIRKQGFPASISTKSAENGLLYRVRVGPELDKKRAEVMKIKIDKLNNLTSIITSADE